MKYKSIGTEEFVGAMVLAIALTFIYYLFGSIGGLAADFGVCLPSPNLWPLPQLWSWGVNLALILGCGVALHFFNKTYSVIQTADMVLPSMFIVLTGTNPWANGLLDSSSIMAAVNIICLAAIFNCYKSYNATQEVFLVSTMLSLGSMFQYAFLFFIPGYVVIALLMQCFRLREFRILFLPTPSVFFSFRGAPQQSLFCGLHPSRCVNFSRPPGFFSLSDLFSNHPARVCWQIFQPPG